MVGRRPLGLGEAVAAQLVGACGLGPGMRALDVAAGTGNVALAIAASGASAEACDLTPALVAVGEARCDAQGEREIPWTVADAEDLPFAGGALRCRAYEAQYARVVARKPG